MTTVLTKQTLRGPLADRTNVVNMKSSRLGKNIRGYNEINAPITPTKKSGRIRKRNILFEDSVYEVYTPKTHSTDKVRKKIPLERDFAPEKTELGILNGDNINGAKSPTVTEQSVESFSKIGETGVKTLTGEFKVLHARNKDITDSKENQQVKKNSVDIEPLNKKMVCTKELVVKIARSRDWEHKVYAKPISYKHKSQRTRTKSVLLDETIYQIYDETKHRGFKKVTKENIPKQVDSIKCNDKEGKTKSKGTGGGSIGTKELVVEITDFVNNSPPVKNILSSNEHTVLREPLTKQNKDKNIDKKLKNTKRNKDLVEGVTQEDNYTRKDSNTEKLIGTKELVVKITRLLDGNIITKKIPTIQNRRNGRKSVVFHETESIAKHLANNGEEINDEKTEIIEEENNTRDTNLKNLQSPKVLFVKLTQLLNDAKKPDKKREGHKKNDLNKGHNNMPEIPKVKFSPSTKTAESHNLRNLQAKNYAEESLLNMDIGDSDKVKIDSSERIHIPIYRKNVPDEPASIKDQNDLYEFTDNSPKSKKLVKNGARKSSIIFDKNTHEILQKIEEKEAKAVKKRGRKKKEVSKPVSRQLYSRKVEGILSNIKKTIYKKNKENTNLVITEKQPETATLKINVQKKNIASNFNHIRTIQVNNFNDETSIIVHHAAKEPSTKDKSKASNMENITSRRGKPLNNNVQDNRTLATRVVEGKPSLNVSRKQKESVYAQPDLISPLLFDSIDVCSDSEDDRDAYCQGQEKVPLNIEKEVPQRLNSAKNIIRKNSVNEGNLLNTFDKLKGSVNVIQSKAVQNPLDNISVTDYDTQDDIDSCFGFDEGSVLPVASTSSKITSRGVINVKNMEHGTKNVESPVDFNVRRPNANSTMINIGTRNRNSSPWRTDWVNTRPNPHFISVKSNALPRIDQEPVLEHTLVEGFEKRCAKTPRKTGTPAKKAPVQQSILSFVGNHVEIENEPVQSSLYDYEAFTSPIKKGKEKENRRVKGVKRNIMGIKDNIVSSTPVQRRALGDISNSSGELFPNSSPEENSYFGFNQSLLVKKTPVKHKNKKQHTMENTETEDVAKPLRFDLSALRSYSAKGRKKKVSLEEEEEILVPDKSISLMEVSNEGNDEEVVGLFEEPEMLHTMSSVPIPGKKHRRKRLDSCHHSDTEEQEKKRKRHKKTKLEIEQEEWVEQFNHMCDEVDQHELELE